MRGFKSALGGIKSACSLCRADDVGGGVGDVGGGVGDVGLCAG